MASEKKKRPMSPVQRMVKRVEGTMGKPVTFEGRKKAKEDKAKKKRK